MTTLRDQVKQALDKGGVGSGIDGHTTPKKPTTPKWTPPVPFHDSPTANNNTPEGGVILRPASLKGTGKVIRVISQPGVKRWMVGFTTEEALKNRFGNHDSGGHVFIPYDGSKPSFTHDPGGLSDSKTYKQEEAWAAAMTKPNSMNSWHTELPDWRKLIESAENYWRNKPKP